MKTSTKEIIESGKAILGVEFGSTRIKAVLIDPSNKPIAKGYFQWENSFENGFGLILSKMFGRDYKRHIVHYVMM